jgi:hypothetical protein
MTIGIPEQSQSYYILLSIGQGRRSPNGRVDSDVVASGYSISDFAALPHSSILPDWVEMKCIVREQSKRL